MLKITNLSVHYGRVRAVQHLSLEVNEGELVGLVREYLATNPDPALHGFLRLTFEQLHAHCGSIVGHAAPVPKLVPIDF